MKHKLAKGVAWVAASRVIVNLIAFGSTLVLARLLTPADFGLVAIASTVAFVIASITQLSLSQALIQHRDPSEDHFHSAWTLNLARAFILAALICALAWPIAWFYSDRRLIQIMLVLGACTILSGGVNPKLVIFSRTLVFWQEFVLSVSQKVVGFIVAIAVAVIWHNYWALVASLVATQVCALILSYALIPYRPRVQVSQVRELLSFSIWLSLGQAVNTINWRADQLAIGYFLGNSSLGLYTVGDNLAVLPTREATAPLAQTLFPGFSRMTADLPRLREAYQRAQALLCAVALPVGAGFALVAHPLVLLTMGPKWVSAVFIVQLLSGILALQTLSSALQPLAMALGETRDLFVRDIINLIIRIPLILIGLIFGGLPGIVYARCVSGSLSTLINMAMTKRLLNLPISDQFKANTRALTSALLMIIVTWTIGREFNPGQDAILLFTQILVMVVVGAATYIMTIFILWRLAGRPSGPESEIASLLLPQLHKLYRRGKRLV